MRCLARGSASGALFWMVTWSRWRREASHEPTPLERLRRLDSSPRPLDSAPARRSGRRRRQKGAKWSPAGPTPAVLYLPGRRQKKCREEKQILSDTVLTWVASLTYDVPKKTPLRHKSLVLTRNPVSKMQRLAATRTRPVSLDPAVYGVTRYTADSRRISSRPRHDGRQVPKAQSVTRERVSDPGLCR